MGLKDFLKLFSIILTFPIWYPIGLIYYVVEKRVKSEKR